MSDTSPLLSLGISFWIYSQIAEMKLYDLIIDKFPDVGCLVDDMPTEQFASICTDVRFPI